MTSLSLSPHLISVSITSQWFFNDAKRKKFNSELGEESLHGVRRYCSRPYHIQKRS
jgi:hypothetical protein